MASSGVFSRTPSNFYIIIFLCYFLPFLSKQLSLVGGAITSFHSLRQVQVEQDPVLGEKLFSIIIRRWLYSVFASIIFLVFVAAF